MTSGTATASEAATIVNRRWQMLIDGDFESGASVRKLYNPATGEQLCEVEEASPEQVERAICAARTAFDSGSWRRASAQERARFLLKAADTFDDRAEELAKLETLNAGKPMREARYDIKDSANCFRYFAGLIGLPLGHTVDVPAPSATQIVREPIGVCGQIVPWNYPFLTAAWKLAPALAAGNCCVLKPSEFTPLSAIRLVEILHELGLPNGTVNLVLGDGPSVGQPIAESMLVDKLSFTGSSRAGRIVAQAALGNLKKVTLELGGKSPMLVFDDADLETAVDYALFAIFLHAGQVCSAGSRFIISNRLYDDFVIRFVERSKKIKVGSGLDEETEMGPLVSEPHMNRVLDYIRVGADEGASLVQGGHRTNGLNKMLQHGYFVDPTIFTDVHPSMRIVQEEIFGPVAVVERFDTEEEAIRLANATRYGLAGAVFTKDITRAYRVARGIKAGVTWVNGYHSTYNECPFGGYKESGWGRECGAIGLDAYTEVKQININLDPSPVRWFK